MSTQPSLIDLRSPRDVGDILSGAFRLYRARCGQWWRIFGIALLITLIALILAAVVAAPLQIAGYVVDSGPLVLLGQILADAITLSFAALAGTLLFFARPRRSAQALRRGPSRAAASRRARSPRSARRRSSPSG